MTMTTQAARRQRNARGQGSRLTDDIVTGALALIERSGSEEAVTLRAVAREVGIAAPSIYPHFPDRDAILLAVVARIFDELRDAVVRAGDAVGDDPAARLIAGCEGYVAFGLEHPARYGVLFAGRRGTALEYCTPMPIGPDGRPAPEAAAGGAPVLAVGAEAFAVLVDGIERCAAAGVSASADVVADAVAVWVGLHGVVSLRTALPGFPWPEPTRFVRGLVISLAKLTA